MVKLLNIILAHQRHHVGKNTSWLLLLTCCVPVINFNRLAKSVVLMSFSLLLKLTDSAFDKEESLTLASAKKSEVCLQFV